jgi:hypothetical protein
MKSISAFIISPLISCTNQILKKRNSLLKQGKAILKFNAKRNSPVKVGIFIIANKHRYVIFYFSPFAQASSKLGVTKPMKSKHIGFSHLSIILIFYPMVLSMYVAANNFKFILRVKIIPLISSIN